jgi:hypothetical protein
MEQYTEAFVGIDTAKTFGKQLFDIAIA